MSPLTNTGGIRKQLGTTPSPKLALGFQSDTWSSGDAGGGGGLLNQTDN